MSTELREDHMNNPLVSIVVCTHNRAAFLKHTMETIFAQTYRPIEILIVDDGSTDGTREFIESCGERVRYYRKEKSCIADTRTVACRLAQGEYIAFQDDDDLMLPDRIDLLLDALYRYPEASFAAGDWAYIDKEGNLTGKKSTFTITAASEEPMVLEDGYKAVLWPLITPLPHTTLFRRADGDRVGWFDDARFFHACSDTDFFARLGKLGPIIYVPKVVSYYRMGHAQIWGKKLLSEYSRFLLFEKHLTSLPADRNELKTRLQYRLLHTMQFMKDLTRKGAEANGCVARDYLKRGLSLLPPRERLAYAWHASVRLPLKTLLRGSSYGR